MLESKVELYKSMKVLSWQIILSTLLDLQHDRADVATVKTLQETILVGQFYHSVSPYEHLSGARLE